MSLYPFDQTGLRIDNRIDNEIHTVNEINGTYLNYIVPRNSPFFRESLVVYDKETGRTLEPGIDYEYSHHFSDADDALARKVYGSFALLDPNYSGQLVIGYQTLGGDFVTNFTQSIKNGFIALSDLSSVDWEDIAGKPPTFPPTFHTEPVTDIDGVKQFIDIMHQIKEAVADPYKSFSLKDARDYEEGVYQPLLDAINSVSAAINNKEMTLEAHHVSEASESNNGEHVLGGKVEGRWFNTIKARIGRAGAYLVNWHHGQHMIDEPGAVVSRVVVNGQVVTESYSRGVAFYLPENAELTLQFKVVGTDAREFYLTRYEEKTTLVAFRVGF